MRLAWQFLCVPTAGDTLETFTLGNTDQIDHFILAEYLVHWDWLLQVLLHPLDFLFNGATVQLDFQNVSLLLALLDQTDLFVETDRERN